MAHNDNLFFKIYSNNDLYPIDFRSSAQTSVEGWSAMSWRMKERKLRLIMSCYTLVNLEKTTEKAQKRRMVEAMVEVYRKRIRLVNTDPITEVTSVPIDELMKELDTDPEEGTSSRDMDSYRYVVMEGKSNQVQLCQTFAREMGIDYDGEFQIYDRVNRKCITVMFAPHSEFHTIDRTYQRTNTWEVCSLALIDPSTFNVRYSEHSGLPGHDKLWQFLKRRADFCRAALGVNDMATLEIDDLIKEVFVCAEFNTLVDQWMRPLIKQKFAEPDREINVAEEMSGFCVWSPDKLLEHMVDLRKRDAPTIQNNLRILPFPLDDFVETELSSDRDMIDLLLEGNSFTPAFPGGEANCNIANDIAKTWDSGDKNNFLLFNSKSRAPEFKNMKEMLGIGAKKRIRNDRIDDCKQPEYRKPSPKKYHPWIADMLDSLGEDMAGPYLAYHDQYQQEMPCDHPLTRLFGPLLDELMAKFKRTEVAKYINKVSQIYSRLGGAYLDRTNRASKMGNVVIMPIVATVHNEELDKTVRLVHGIVVRGPHTVRQPTDSINMIILELIKNDDKGRAFANHIKKPTFLYDNFGRLWCMRQHSIQKKDTAFLSFINNSIFLPVNMLGEILLQVPMELTEDKIKETFNDILTHQWKWFTDRIAENTLMACIGNSQEEGALAQIRKFFMIIMAWHRSENCVGWDYSEFCESLNECMLDSPLAIYFGTKIRDTMVTMVELYCKERK